MARRIPPLRIQNKITIPYLLLLATIALIGTPLASNFVSNRISQQAKDELQREISTIQSYFDEKERDLKAVAQSIGIRPDIAAHLRNGRSSMALAALVPEKNRHQFDFIILLDENGQPLTSDANLKRPEEISQTSVSRFAQYEATYVDLLDVQPLLDPPESAGAMTASGTPPHVREPSRFALVAGAPVKTNEVHGYVLVGRYVNPAMLYRAARFAGSFREEDGRLTPRYIVSLYSSDEGKVVASSADYEPAAAGTPTAGDQVVSPGATSVSLPGGRCGTCHGADNPAQMTTPPEQVTRRVDVFSMGGEEYMVVHGELLISGVPKGIFSILTDTREVVAAQTAARNGLIAGTLVLVVLIVSIGYLVSRTLTRRIVNLSTATGDIAGGDLSREVPLFDGDEIGDLSRSIAKMTRTLQVNTETIQSRLEEISLLYAFSSAASSTLDLREILQTLLQSTARVLGADSGSIMMVGKSGTDLRLMANLEDHRLFRMDRRVPISDGIAGWVVRNRRTIVLPRDFDRYPELEHSARRDVASSLCVPIESKDSILGVLNLNSSNPKHVFDEEAATLSTALANQAAVAIENAQLFETQQELHLRVVRALGAAIDAKDRYTQGHSALVARYSVALGRELGLSKDELSDLEIAGYLHDIGKIGIYDEILNKEGRLSAEERQIIQTHPVIGATIIEPIGFSWSVVGSVRHHHEWWNGQGYPDGLKGTQIPHGARILAIVDAFEAMTAVRPYKPAMTFEEAWMEISRMAGLQFDPEMVECFLRVLDSLDAVHEVASAR